MRHGGSPWRSALGLGNLVALVAVLAALHFRTASSHAAPPHVAFEAQGGSAEPGRSLFGDYCSVCHTMNGGASAPLIGPDLADLASRPLIAGAVVNTSENLVRWIRDPQSLKPGTLMPALGLTTEQAGDLAAFLLSSPESPPEDSDAPSD